MKKIIIVTLILALVTGGTLAFADETATNDTKMLDRNRPAIMGPGGPHGKGIPRIGNHEVILEILDMTEDELKEEIQAGKTIIEIAEDASVLDELKSALYDVQKERLEALVAESKLTEDQAAEMLEKYQEMLDENKLGMIRPGNLSVEGRLDIKKEQQDVILDILGKTEDELKALREEGKTVIELAEEKEVLDELKEALYNIQKEHMDVLVDEGRLTEDQAEEMLEKYQSMLDEDKLFVREPAFHERRNKDTRFTTNNLDNQASDI